MRKRITTSVSLAVLGLLVAAATAWAVSWVPVYANDMSTTGLRAQLFQVGKGKCSISGKAGTLRVKVGKKTTECFRSTTFVGRDLSVIVAGKLLSPTPGSIQKRTFIAISQRLGDGGQFQFQVFPAKGSWKLIRITPNGRQTALATGKSAKVKGLNIANKMRLDAINTSNTNCRLIAFDNGKRLASVSDPSCNDLSGRYTTFSVGSTKNANGALASFDNLQVSVPNPN